jgi:hypothetical protein
MGDLLSAVLDAITSSTDPQRLRDELGRRFPPAPAAAASSPASQTSDELLRLIVLSDMLDDEILSARPGDKAFPLRMLFGDLAQSLSKSGEAESAFAFASAVNFYFRAEQDEEARIAVGLTTSRLYYAFMRARSKEPRELAATSPLLAALLTTQLDRSSFESVDHQKTFDGQSHDREPGSSTGAQIQAARSFLCRVAATGVVRSRALVRT